MARATGLALGTVLGRGASGRWGPKSDSEEEHEYELDSGVFCGVWERDTLLAYGGWDERWSRNEDSEMAARFFERGETLICVPAMAAEYSPRDSLPRCGVSTSGTGSFRAMTARRHPETLRRSNLLPAGLVVTVAVAVAGPRRLKTVARAAASAYAATVVAAGLRGSAAAEEPGDAALVPVALAAMHLAFGAGFLRGSLRNGVPVAAIARIAGLRDRARRAAPPAEPVFAPSLAERSDLQVSPADPEPSQGLLPHV